MLKDLLLLGASGPEMELLRTRLVRSGYRVVPAKTPEQAHALLRLAGSRIGVAIVPGELPVANLDGALRFLRRLVPSGELAFLAAGRDPGPEGRRRLRDAGIQVAAFDPVDLHTLRFQVNRALAAGRPVRIRRSTLRAPADWSVTVRAGVRQKEGRVYAASPSGAFVALSQPWMVRTQVDVRLSIPSVGPVTTSGRVVMTNVPGNVMRRSLPFGMGIQFEQVSDAGAVALMMYAEERTRALAL